MNLGEFLGLFNFRNLILLNLLLIFMAKQSLKDPKFRCNACKEFYTAEENPVHYQCPKHGYLCEKYIIDHDFCFTASDSKSEKKIHLPSEFIGCCHLYKSSTSGESVKRLFIPKGN